MLADEINRAPAKVQSALLEAMQERQVTIGTETYKLEEPFLVLATQNPLEQEGTYPLPEAQADRFLLKIKIGYPTLEEERQIIRRNLNDDEPPISKVVSVETLLKARQAVKKIYMDEKVEQYILDIVFATRQPDQYGLQQIAPLLQYGASPRASIALAKAARAMAFLDHRGFVTPDDVKSICLDVLRHRIGLTFEAEAENIGQEDLIRSLSDVARNTQGDALRNTLFQYAIPAVTSGLTEGIANALNFDYLELEFNPFEGPTVAAAISLSRHLTLQGRRRIPVNQFAEEDLYELKLVYRVPSNNAFLSRSRLTLGMDNKSPLRLAIEYSIRF